MPSSFLGRSCSIYSCLSRGKSRSSVTVKCGEHVYVDFHHKQRNQAFRHELLQRRKGEKHIQVPLATWVYRKDWQCGYSWSRVAPACGWDDFIFDGLGWLLPAQINRPYSEGRYLLTGEDWRVHGGHKDSPSVKNTSTRYFVITKAKEGSMMYDSKGSHVYVFYLEKAKRILFRALTLEWIYIPPISVLFRSWLHGSRCPWMQRDKWASVSCLLHPGANRSKSCNPCFLRTKRFLPTSSQPESHSIHLCKIVYIW